MSAFVGGTTNAPQGVFWPYCYPCPTNAYKRRHCATWRQHGGIGGISVKVVYISGPMTGMPELNFPAFHAAARMLRDLGHDVRNPAEVGEEPGRTWEDYMRKDLRLLCDCTHIYLLAGWEKSKGAHLELHIAHRLGMEVLFA